MPLAFSNPKTRTDLAQLKFLLHPIIEESFYENTQDLNLLNIACGRADETGILAEILSMYCQQLQITGIDIRNREIGEAKQRWGNMRLAKTQFFTQNASQIGHINQLDGPYDLVFIRHQNYWNGAEVWHRIYDNALHRLNSQGILIITSYFCREHLQAIQAIKAMGGKIIASIRNPNSRPILDAPNKSVDRHIAFFSR